MNTLQRHYWLDRYALRDSKGEPIEDDIEQTWDRVSTAIADTEEEKESFYGILEGFKFVPGGRILAGAGAESQKTFYNCYVIPVETKARRENRKSPAYILHGDHSVHDREALREQWEHWVKNPGPVLISDDIEIQYIPQQDTGNDSREAIFDTINTMVGIMSRGGGVGINWSVLRPADSYLTRVSGHSSGPVGWMDVASTAVGEVIQGGSRRGAAMFMLDVWHPDVLKFINAKRDNRKITNANVSVGVSDAFMEALSKDEDWTFVFPDTTHPEYDRSWDGDIEAWRQRGLPVVEFGTVPASRVWREIAEGAHASGEPGVIFLDRYNELSTANGQERIICVNPCGEQGLGAYSVCNLGAMNLYAYIREEMVYSDMGPEKVAFFDYPLFAKDVRTAISFLDNVIDKSPDYLPETKAQQEKLRRIGLGVMGLADALVALGIRYGSEQAVQFTERVFRTMKDNAIMESSLIAIDKGPAKGWQDDMWDRPYLAEYIQRMTETYDVPFPTAMRVPLRNLFLLTQAPTGTTSLLADVNSGIEPYFNIKTWREDRTGGRFVFARAVAEVMGVDEESEHGTYDRPDYIVTSKDVTPDEHIAMQAAVQKYVDSSVSKTVNAPKEQGVEDTARVFTRAYYSGLKGIAYYRDGSRDQQVLYHKKPNERIAELEAEVARLKAELADSISLKWVGTKAQTESTNGGTLAFAPIALESHGSGCPTCSGDVTHEEGCQKCYNCGWSAC